MHPTVASPYVMPLSLQGAAQSGGTPSEPCKLGVKETKENTVQRKEYRNVGIVGINMMKFIKHLPGLGFSYSTNSIYVFLQKGYYPNAGLFITLQNFSKTQNRLVESG